jgi:hypothetical protein
VTYFVATDKTFEKLKRKELEFESEVENKEPKFEFRKKRKQKRQVEGIPDTSPISKKGQKSQFGEFDSDDSKSDQSVEELITEEMFQKALQATLQKGKILIITLFRT